MPETTFPFLAVNQRGKEFILTRLPAGLLTRVSYAAVRGVDQEPGAVQRVLNSRRINSVKTFTLAGGDYPNVIVLNWVEKNHPIIRSNGRIEIPDMPRAAQLIDGQHRVAGLTAAIEEDRSLENLQIPVAIYEGLDTATCANIFLSINTEQKPVPRSLVFDLYGVADETIVDSAAARATDIARHLNDEPSSPYAGQIKLPGSPRRKGGIALSTAVTAIKPLVDEKGDLEQMGMTSLEMQTKVIGNFFSALRSRYDRSWDDTSNAFMYAAGFMGAIDFLRFKMLPYCNNLKSFTTEKMSEAIQVDQSDLILQDEVKGKGGKDAPKVIYERLLRAFSPQISDAGGFDI